METVELSGLGVRTSVQLTGEDPAALAATVRTAWSRCLVPTGSELTAPPLQVHIAPDASSSGSPRASHGTGPQPLEDTDLDLLMPRLTQAVTMGAITAQTGNLFMMHAGAVGNPENGAVIAYAAAGGTGKTTLSRRLGRRWGYITDETVGVASDGSIVPYPKPLSVRPDPTRSRADGRMVKSEESPDLLGLRRWPTKAVGRLAGLVLLRRSSASVTPVVEELDTLTAMLQLAPETSSLSALRSPLTWLAALLDSIQPVWRISYAEASDIEPLLATRLEGRA